VALARNQLDEAIPAFQEVIKEVPTYERARMRSQSQICRLSALTEKPSP
jgi:hypothetical protein